MLKFNILKIKDNTESVYQNLVDANVYVADTIQQLIENEYILKKKYLMIN